MNTLVSPSILSADFANLGRDIAMLNNSEADWIHVDVMDGMFVPNISFGFPVMKAIKPLAKKPLDVHLMIEAPDRYVEQFAAAGADLITVHYEACPHLHRSIQAIKKTGVKAGVALNPHTPVSLLEDIVQDLDLVLVMTVNPGFGGQEFIEHSYEKIRRMRSLASAVNPDLIIEVDGGVSAANAAQLVQAGANMLVAGNAIFSAKEPEAVISGLKKAHWQTA
ncbi:MAG: ribulose-phosphate 3-epimerase [Mucilaginibacter polytrichastri]|nr:ribulose-phosphate 3-epimerase [Mucilaginibacter polytrichastri]